MVWMYHLGSAAKILLYNPEHDILQAVGMVIEDLGCNAFREMGEAFEPNEDTEKSAIWRRWIGGIWVIACFCGQNSSLLKAG